MQTLVLGTPASQEPLESFFQRLGDEAVEIVDSDGRTRARITPVTDSEPTADEIVARSSPVFRYVEAAIMKDLDELKQRALRPSSGITTEELLKKLNSLPLPS